MRLEHIERTGLSVPKSLESPGAKLIYLYLRVCGNSTLEDLHEDLNLPIVSLYGLLSELESRDIVRRQGRFYRCEGELSSRSTSDQFRVGASRSV